MSNVKVLSAADIRGNSLDVFEPDTANHVVRSFTGTSAQTVALTENIYRVIATEDCHYEIGDNPTAAAASSPLLKANTVEYIYLTSSKKIAFIQSSTGGNAHITPMQTT